MKTENLEHVETSVHNRIARIVMNDPATLNALTVDMMKEVNALLDQYEKDPDVRVVVLQGKGRAFSAGAKREFLEELPSMSKDDIQNIIYKHFAGGAKKIRNYSKPTVAAMRGAATGAGLEIALNCDFRICTKDALLVETWIHLGLMDPLGGMALLPRLVGLSKANEMLLLGERVSGEEAERIGLVNRAVEEEKLDETVDNFASRLADAAPLAIAAMKDGIRRGFEQSPDQMADQNIEAQAKLAGTEDFKEGVAALFGKRKANFKGQ